MLFNRSLKKGPPGIMLAAHSCRGPCQLCDSPDLSPWSQNSCHSPECHLFIWLYPPWHSEHGEQLILCWGGGARCGVRVGCLTAPSSTHWGPPAAPTTNLQPPKMSPDMVLGPLWDAVTPGREALSKAGTKLFLTAAYSVFGEERTPSLCTGQGGSPARAPKRSTWHLCSSRRRQLRHWGGGRAVVVVLGVPSSVCMGGSSEGVQVSFQSSLPWG